MLTTVDSVIDALGGTTSVAALGGVGLPAVSNWKARGAIPAEKFLILRDALRERGKGEPDPSLFGFHTPETVAEARP